MNRLAPLDGLRAAAVLIVMFSHAGLGHVIPGGFGVTIFFFLSGYLITSLLVIEWEKTARIDFGAFYLRRFVRIVPPMVIAIIVTVALSAIGFGKDIVLAGLIWDFLFLSNYAEQIGVGSGIPIPLWSLAIEEHFYLLFPLLFLGVCRRQSIAKVAALCAILCIVVLLVRLGIAIVEGPVPQIYYWSHTRIDSILFGCILATWNNPISDRPPTIGSATIWLVLSVVLIALTLVVRDPFFRETWRYSIQGIGLFLFFNFALRSSGMTASLLSLKPLRIVADQSYFLYLIHLPLFLAASYLPVPRVGQYLVGFALSFGAATFVRHAVELPLLRWRQGMTKQKPVPRALRPKGLE